MSFRAGKRERDDLTPNKEEGRSTGIHWIQAYHSDSSKGLRRSRGELKNTAILGILLLVVLFVVLALFNYSFDADGTSNAVGDANIDAVDAPSAPDAMPVSRIQIPSAGLQQQITLGADAEPVILSLLGRCRSSATFAISNDLQPCEDKPGWMLQPGWSLDAAFMGRHGDVLEVEIVSASSTNVGVLIRDDSGHQRLELANAGRDGNGTARGEWRCESDTSRPYHVSVALPAEAHGPVCLSKLSVQREPRSEASGIPAPRIEGVVVILIDTLRADHLPFMSGTSGVSTPNLEALASESIQFTNATAHSNYTKPSVGTLLSGVYPHVHGALLPKARIRPSVRLLSQHLQDVGIDTQAVVSNHFLNNRKFGFFRGWNTMKHVSSYKACLGGEPVVERVRQWLDGWEPEGPFFAYIHLMDPHAPYAPPSSYLIRQIGMVPVKGRLLPKQTSQFIRKVRRGEEPPPDKTELALLRDFYRADVSHMDQVVGSVLDHLKQAGILDRVLLIVASDHGEEFMEHGGLGHGTNLRRELVHVPLLVRWPDGAVTGRIDERVGLIDVAPTILASLGSNRPPYMKGGRNLLDLVSGTSQFWDDGAYLIEHKNTKQKGVVAGQWKLLVGRKSVILTHVRDGKESRIDPTLHPVTVQYLSSKMTELLSGRGPVGSPHPHIIELSEEEKDKLRALGYLLDGD
jgi:arylsulfatase